MQLILRSAILRVNRQRNIGVINLFAVFIRHKMPCGPGLLKEVWGGGFQHLRAFNAGDFGRWHQ
ncbi:hypothetical protein D3C71_1694600 [compost metagenome]